MKEATNEFRITGVLKTKELREQTTRTGKEAIMGHLVVEVNEGGRVHNHRIELFANKTKQDGSENGLYNSYKTIMSDYKSKDQFADDADVISVNGNIAYNVYKGRNGLGENVRLRGLFANRVAKDSVQESQANLTLVIDGYTPVMKNDQPTDFVNVKAFTSGYNNSGIKIMDLKAPVNSKIEQSVPAGTTIDTTIKINNYIVTKKVEKPSENVLFGEMKSVVETNSYERNLMITGISLPGEQYTPDDINAMKESIKKQITDAQARENTATSNVATQTMSAEAVNNALPF